MLLLSFDHTCIQRLLLSPYLRVALGSAGGQKGELREMLKGVSHVNTRDGTSGKHMLQLIELTPLPRVSFFLSAKFIVCYISSKG